MGSVTVLVWFRIVGLVVAFGGRLETVVMSRDLAILVLEIMLFLVIAILTLLSKLVGGVSNY